MQRGVAIFSFYHRNYSKPSTDHLTHGVLMASIHPAGDSYNHRPSDLHDVCHPTGNFILSSSCVVWLVVRSRGSREKDSEKVSTYAWWYSYLRDCLSLNSQEIIHNPVLEDKHTLFRAREVDLRDKLSPFSQICDIISCGFSTQAPL